MNKFVEFKVKPVTRYIVTKYEREENDEGTVGSAGSVSEIGEYSNHEIAYQVAYAVAKQEHERLGYPVGDERIKYPEQFPNAFPNGGFVNGHIGEPKKNITVTVSNTDQVINPEIEKRLRDMFQTWKRELPALVRTVNRGHK